jgi:transglutaminase-like putative cysteine protease
MDSSSPGTLLEVVHETHYDYASPVSLSHHRAHLRPLDDPHQRCEAWALQVEPAPDTCTHGHDAWGNATTHFSLAQPHRALRVRATSRVRVAPRFDALDASASPAWDVVAAGLRYVARAPWPPAVEFALPSPYVPRLSPLRDYAAPSFPAGRPVAEAALELMRRVHADFRYDSGSTEVDTPLAQAFAQRRGVCQDFAHLLAGALRMLGLPARYVSGYLRTTPAPGEERLVGADASHAWVQLWCPDTPGVPGGWLDLDPTNDAVPGVAHVRLAVGRDYGDVTPLRGVIRGGGRHRMHVAVDTREVPAEPGVLVATLN